jgi:hypothetical protein
LANHIRRVRAPGGDIDAVLEIAEPDAAVADPELLDSCLEAALAEMVALGPQPQTLARGRTARRSA